MKDSTSAARWVARATSAALWIVGSAYLIKGELHQPAPDYVLIGAIPVVWLVVCALPILVSSALRDRQWLAAGVLAVGALVGSAYTLTATLGRQADARDLRAVEAVETAKQRAEIERELRQAKDMLQGAIAKCGEGRKCLASTQATIGVYKGAVAGHEARLAALKPVPPPGVELRVAAALAVIRGGVAADYMTAVGLFLPCLFGLLCEIGMLGAAMYGFHPTGRKVVGNSAGVSDQQPLATVSHASTLTDTDRYTDAELEQLRRLLRSVNRPVTNNELAALMGCQKGTASKAVTKALAAGIVSRQRVGREVAISLH